MKKLFTIFMICAVLLCCLSACAPESNSSETPSQSETFFKDENSETSTSDISSSDAVNSEIVISESPFSHSDSTVSQEEPVTDPYLPDDLNGTVYSDMSFLNSEQLSLVNDNFDTIYHSVFSQHALLGNYTFTGEYFNVNVNGLNSSLSVSNYPWGIFKDDMLRVFTEEYFDLLVANGHFADRNGFAALLDGDGGDWVPMEWSEQYIVTHTDIQTISFFHIRYFYEQHTDESAEAFALRMASCEDYETAATRGYELKHTQDGWRVNDFYTVNKYYDGGRFPAK